MIGQKRIACIIPARLKSTRFPRKILSLLRGKPLIQWVYEAAKRVSYFDTVRIAIDSPETAEVIKTFGGEYEITSETCPSGTDRLVELATQKRLQADIWVCWQGDEPFIKEEMIRDLLQSCQQEGSDVWTLKKKIKDQEEIHSPHVVKVVTDIQDYALYFSRSTIPYYRDPIPEDQKQIFKHVGLYAYRQETLEKIAHLPSCELEKAELLEQLRFLYNQLRVKVHETEHEAFGIDLPEHLVRAERQT
jgi:3-deoxy-manno-octulosonate cytidylyltransferase (CMP-KDO synthetase)